MSSDDFLDGLKGDWRSHEVELGNITSRVAEGERLIRKEKIKRLIEIAVLGAGCLFFVYQNWVIGDPAFHLAAVAFFTAMLLAIGDFVFLRRSQGQELLGSPGDVLAQAERQGKIALRLAEGKLAHAVLLVVCAIILAAFSLAGMTSTLSGLFIAAVWFVAAIGVFLYHHARKSAAASELGEIKRLRAELESEE